MCRWQHQFSCLAATPQTHQLPNVLIVQLGWARFDKVHGFPFELLRRLNGLHVARANAKYRGSRMSLVSMHVSTCLPPPGPCHPKTQATSSCLHSPRSSQAQPCETMPAKTTAMVGPGSLRQHLAKSRIAASRQAHTYLYSPCRSF